jgi:hypothetical protein
METERILDLTQQSETSVTGSVTVNQVLPEVNCTGSGNASVTGTVAGTSVTLSTPGFVLSYEGGDCSSNVMDPMTITCTLINNDTLSCDGLEFIRQ